MPPQSQPPHAEPRQERGRESSSWRRRLTAALWLRAILALSGAVFLPAIGYDFVYDDNQQILLNPWLVGWTHIGQFFTRHLWAFSPDSPISTGNFYRPLFLLWLLLLNHLSGGIPGFFHLATIALHVIAVYLCYALALRLSGERATALFAALIFGLHPVHIEAVAWISGGTEPLFTVPFLGSLLCYLRSGDEGGNHRGWMVGSWLCFALALLGKETALVLPGVILVHCLASGAALRASGTSIGTRRRVSALRPLMPYVLLAALYCFCRYRALGGWSDTKASLGREAVLTLPLRAWWYLEQLVWPFRLSPYYRTPLASDMPLAAILALAAMLAALCAWGFWKARRNPGWAMTLAIGVLALAPVLTTNFIGLHDRYLYLPSFSFSLAAAAVICHLRMKTAGWTRGLRGWLAALIVVALGASLIGQEPVWESDISLFTRAVEIDPEPRTISRLAAVYGDQDHGKGVRILLDGVARFPHSVLLQQAAGFYYYSQNKPDEAAIHLRIAVAEAGNSSIRARSLCCLGMIDSAKGDRLRAETELREALRLSPAQLECQRALNALEGQAR